MYGLRLTALAYYMHMQHALAHMHMHIHAHEHEHDMHMHMCMQNIANQNIAHTLAVREEPLHVTPTQRTARVGRDVGSKHFLCPFPGPRAVSR